MTDPQTVDRPGRPVPRPDADPPRRSAAPTTTPCPVADPPRSAGPAKTPLGPPWRLPAGERGQATAEYALVLLGAAAVALMLTAWAAKSGAIADLFDAVVGRLIDKL